MRLTTIMPASRQPQNLYVRLRHIGISKEFVELLTDVASMLEHSQPFVDLRQVIRFVFVILKSFLGWLDSFRQIEICVVRLAGPTEHGAVPAAALLQ